MGGTIQRLCATLIPTKRYVLLAGIKGSGKTTVLYGSRLKPGWEQHKIDPTLGYNYEEVRTRNGLLAVFDSPGTEELFPVTKTLFENINFEAIVFVFTISKEPMKYIEAKRKIKFLVNEAALKKCVLAVVANIASDVEAQFKQPAFLMRALGLDELKSVEHKKLFIFDAKYTPKESDKLWNWILDEILE